MYFLSGLETTEWILYIIIETITQSYFCPKSVFLTCLISCHNDHCSSMEDIQSIKY